ncbi:MAG: serine hydrolase, partial [Flavisolibacter sp.]
MTLSSPEKACLKAFSYSLSFITKNYLIILGLTICFLFTGCTFFKKPLTPASELKTGKFKPGIKDVFLADLLSRYPEYFDTLIKNNNKWHIKIIYTRIDRKANNRPVFTNYYYNIEPDQYFYPASTVKLPVSILSLQKLHELKIRGLNRATTMITESGWTGQSKTYNDPDASDGRPTIEMYIKKIFLVSDNNAFNRLYEFLGQEYINGRLHKLGFDSTQIVHRLNISLSEDQNRHTNPVIFYDSNSRIIFSKPLEESKMEYQQRSNYLGIGYIKDNELIRKPFDFSKKNRIT